MHLNWYKIYNNKKNILTRICYKKEEKIVTKLKHFGYNYSKPWCFKYNWESDLILSILRNIYNYFIKFQSSSNKIVLLNVTHRLENRELSLEKNDGLVECVGSMGDPCVYGLITFVRVWPLWNVLREGTFLGKADCRVVAGEALVRLLV